MLCNSKINNRPDKQLQACLIKLAFALVGLTALIILFFLYPEYYLYLVASCAACASYCLLLTIKTLDAGEAAISYGGFANEIIRSDFKARRIETPKGEAVIQNDPAKDLFRQNTVLRFLEKHLAEGPTNKNALGRLKTACKNLSAEKVTLSLTLRPETDRVFNGLEWYEVSLRPMYLKKPQIFEGAFSIKKIRKETYFYWSADNITARRNMEQIFREESARLHDFLDDMPIGLYTADKDYRFEYVNHNFAALLQHPETELQGRRLNDFLAPNSLFPEKKDSWQGKLHFTNGKGEIAEAYVFQTNYREDEKIKVRGAVIGRLPSTNQLEAALEKASDKIGWLFNNSPVGILFVDDDGKIADTNATAVKFFAPRLAARLKDSNLQDLLNPAERETFRGVCAKLHAEPASSLSLDIHLNAERPDLITTLYLSGMHRFHAAQNETAPGFVIYLIDVTKQRSLEQQFAQAQKMQAVGQLAGGVAHDFNNLLTAMIGFTDLLLQRHGVGDPSFADLIQIKQNANRAASLVRQLLAFSRKQPLQPKLIDITESFAELSHMLKRILGEKITLQIHHQSDLGYVKVDPVQLSQVIINLAVNAKDAMNGDGTLHIATRTHTLKETFRFGDDTVKPGEFVVIDVKDSGCGIPPENMSRIFDPFFSTKENIVGSGTGLGLAMVYGIVRQTEGYITVDSTVGVGTTFSIHLPRFEEKPEEETETDREVVTNKAGRTILRVQEKISAPLNVNQKIIMGMNVSNAIDRSHAASSKDNQQIRILFVEDEDSVRSFAVRALKKKGYDVIGCNSGENALEQLEKDNKFDLLITDMVMPGISGAELTKIVKEKLKDIKVILASGYSEEIVRQELDNFDDFDFITKPYSLGDLTAKVYDVTKEK